MSIGNSTGKARYTWASVAASVCGIFVTIAYILGLHRGSVGETLNHILAIAAILAAAALAYHCEKELRDVYDSKGPWRTLIDGPW